jgi:hypothetical protein
LSAALARLAEILGAEEPNTGAYREGFRLVVRDVIPGLDGLAARLAYLARALDGATWEDVASDASVSRQSAQRRWPAPPASKPVRGQRGGRQ